MAIPAPEARTPDNIQNYSVSSSLSSPIPPASPSPYYYCAPLLRIYWTLSPTAHGRARDFPGPARRGVQWIRYFVVWSTSKTNGTRSIMNLYRWNYNR